MRIASRYATSVMIICCLVVGIGLIISLAFRFLLGLQLNETKPNILNPTPLHEPSLEISSLLTSVPLKIDNFCEDNPIIRELDKPALMKSIQIRYNSRITALQSLTNLLNDDAAIPRRNWDPCFSANCIQAANRGWGGLKNNDNRWAMLGKQSIETCKKSKGLEFCFPFQENCNLFLILEESQSLSPWIYETRLAQGTNCRIYSFNCMKNSTTVPKKLEGRVKFFKFCLGNPDHPHHVSNLVDLMQIANVNKVDLLKIDIKGMEYEVLRNFIEFGNSHFKQHKENILPSQIVFQLHFLTSKKKLPWYGRDLSPAEIYLFHEHLFYDGGYVLADKYENPYCKHCFGAVYIKVVC